jgi:hypothetical protein
MLFSVNFSATGLVILFHVIVPQGSLSRTARPMALFEVPPGTLETSVISFNISPADWMADQI